MRKTFQSFSTEYGLLVNTNQDYQEQTLLFMQSPLDRSSWTPDGDTYFIYAFGPCLLRLHNVPAGDKTRTVVTIPMMPGFYCAVSRMHFSVEGKALMIQHIGYEAPFTLGGPLEKEGRLKYIDGCTDSLLIPPTIKGDPCLNHLHFPKMIDQTMHTHPSIRAGLVARGSGWCRYKDAEGNLQMAELRPGMCWVIHPDCEHAFLTKDETMDVIAYHPDSDFGPEHQEHPMINRTIVEGTSAKELTDIQTK